MNSTGILKIGIGLILMVAAIYSFFPPLSWWDEFLVLLKGGIPVLVFVIGLIFLLLGFEN